MKNLLDKIKENLKIKDLIIGFFIINIILITIDYFNVITLVGINIKNMNFDFLSIFINSMVVILLYCITYKTLDEENIKKTQNIKNISIYILEDIYNRCKLFINIASKTENNKYLSEFLTNDEMRKMCENTPFNKETFIFDNIKNGILSEERVKEYFSIKQSYISFFYIGAVLYDEKEYNIIKEEKEIIIEQIDNELRELQELKRKKQ